MPRPSLIRQSTINTDGWYEYKGAGGGRVPVRVNLGRGRRALRRDAPARGRAASQPDAETVCHIRHMPHFRTRPESRPRVRRGRAPSSKARAQIMPAFFSRRVAAAGWSKGRRRDFAMGLVVDVVVPAAAIARSILSSCVVSTTSTSRAQRSREGFRSGVSAMLDLETAAAAATTTTTRPAIWTGRLANSCSSKPMRGVREADDAMDG